MWRKDDPNRNASQVLCIACRRPYLLGADAGGCPRCGCSSWIAARLADEPPGTPATPTPG